MGGVFKNMASLVNALQAEMREAMEETTDNSLADAQLNTKAFYAGGIPVQYERTGQYGSSPNTHGVTGSGNTLFSDVYLDDEYKYNTGTYSARKVFEEAEIGGSGIVGTPGTWERTEEDIQRNIDDCFEKRFN